MAEISDLNGNPIQSAKSVSIILKYELNSGKLAVDGDLQNLDLCLNVLSQAHRWLSARYEAQQRLFIEAEIQQQRQIAGMIRQ